MKSIKKKTTKKRRNPVDPPAATRWKKGQSGNPQGARLHDPEIKAIKKLTKSELKEVGSLILENNFTRLEELALDPSASTIQRMVASLARRVIFHGDPQAFDTLLNRLIGKVKEEVEHTGNLNSPQVIVSLPSNGREVKLIPDGSTDK